MKLIVQFDRYRVNYQVPHKEVHAKLLSSDIGTQLTYSVKDI